MRLVDRGDFCPSAPYDDAPQPIGHGVTISAPHMHGRPLQRRRQGRTLLPVCGDSACRMGAAYCLEELVDHCRPGACCLDVGCGSGIFTVLMSQLARHQATVVGIDHVAELVALSRDNTGKSFSEQLGRSLCAWPARLARATDTALSRARPD
jgi:protein-L-isoaspartate(D-aspartate) O-methyltransferase